MKTKITLGFVILVAIVLAINYGNITKSNTANNNETVKIGVVLGQTGAASNWALYAKRAADLAVKEINSNGGVDGKKVELVYEDSKTTPTGSVAAFQKLSDVDHINVVIGDLWGFLTSPIIPIAGSKKVLVISPTLMNRSVEGSSDYFYTLGHTVEGQKGAVDTFIKQYPTAKTVAIVCWNDSWGNAHTELFKKESEANGLKVVLVECTNDLGSDYRTIMTKVKSVHPDLIMMTAELTTPFKTMYELGLKVPTLTTTIIVDALEIQKMPRIYGEGVYLMDWKPNQEFIDKFQKEYGVYPIMEAQNSYESVRSAVMAIKNNPADPHLGIKKVSYESVDGNIDFTKGDHITVNKAEAKLFVVTKDGYDEVK